MPAIELESILTCPHCGAGRRETMPENYWLVMYECRSWNASLKPNKGDCWVFCSFGFRALPRKTAPSTARGTARAAAGGRPDEGEPPPSGIVILAAVLVSIPLGLCCYLLLRL